MQNSRQVTEGGRRLMTRISETSFHLLKAEVEAMPPEEAGEAWGLMEPYLPRVCARASSRKRDAEWLVLLKKMDLYKRRAEEGQK